MLTLPTPFGCPNTFTIIRNNFSPLPLRTAEISPVGGVWIFSGTTHCSLTCSNSIITNCKSLIVIPIQTQNWEIIQ